MAKMVEIICKCGCGKKKMVRQADVDRGWGLYYNKSCKARHQEKKTGQYRAYMRGEGVSHAAKRRGENVNEALAKYVEKHGSDNYMGSGVDKETFMYYKEEYGGWPVFNRNGDYEGFVMSQADMRWDKY